MSWSNETMVVCLFKKTMKIPSSHGEFIWVCLNSLWIHTSQIPTWCKNPSDFDSADAEAFKLVKNTFSHLGNNMILIEILSVACVSLPEKKTHAADFGLKTASFWEDILRHSLFWHRCTKGQRFHCGLRHLCIFGHICREIPPLAVSEDVWVNEESEKVSKGCHGVAKLIINIIIIIIIIIESPKAPSVLKKKPLVSEVGKPDAMQSGPWNVPVVEHRSVAKQTNWLSFRGHIWHR